MEGNREVYENLKDMLVNFELGFEIMPGTGDADLSPDYNTFEQEPLGDTAGG